ncbi:MAG: cysteine--tRNA ligase, partial [Propionicimonas sp.]
MSFHLYDSAARQVRAFVPLVAGEVSIYHCGLTVQSAPHVGHIRKEVVFDVLRRWLSHSGYDVRVVANVTDIDDKILAKSAEAGVPWFAHAYHFERELHDAYAALGCLPPTYEPRATGHITEMLELIEILLERGHAYVAPDGSGDVYFDVRSWPTYGALSGQKVDEMEAAADADPRGKRDPRDFALWKGHKPEEPITASWPSAWGRGRPGWHLECSAMAGKYLGDEFDIHGGGIDLRFPHHENELAQSRAAGRRFARYWMHNAWVTAAGEKMSKSLGNGALVSEVTKTYPARAVRLYLLAPHYRSALEFSDTSLAEATAQLARIDAFLQRAGELASPAGGSQWSPEVVVPAEFSAAMDDDLGTPGAMATLFGAIREGNTALDAGNLEAASGAYVAVRSMLGVLGLDPAAPE